MICTEINKRSYKLLTSMYGDSTTTVVVHEINDYLVSHTICVVEV